MAEANPQEALQAAGSIIGNLKNVFGAKKKKKAAQAEKNKNVAAANKNIQDAKNKIAKLNAKSSSKKDTNLSPVIVFASVGLVLVILAIAGFFAFRNK